MKTIITEFEKVTKYPLLSFLTDYRDFLDNSYPPINDYFSGNVDRIENKHLINLQYITNECKTVLAQFKNFSNKFSSCGYWELMELIDELNTTIEKINKLPKFRRTSMTKKGYQPVIQVIGEVGGYRTMEDVANSIKEANGDNADWIDLMLSNDLNENDWEIDKLTPVKVLLNNKNDIVVTTILEQPIGKRIYGRDIARVINFTNNDLEVKEYQDNIEQKCDILLNLSRGDVPENMLFGKNISLVVGVSAKQFAYPALIKDIVNNFLQNDLFEYVTAKDFYFDNGNVNITCEIKTKYDYKTEKTITI